MEETTTEINVEKFLLDKGYKAYPQSCDYPYKKRCVYQKRIENESVCETNDKLYISVDEYAYQKIDNRHDMPDSYIIYIRAEKLGLWWDLQCYSLHDSEVVERFDEIEKTLIQMFNVMPNIKK